MTWDAYNRRKEALRDMIVIADRRHDVTLSELLDAVDENRQAFANETELLFELQMTWFQRLSGQMDRLINDGLESPELIAVTAWVNTAAELPGVRALLDAHRDEPALRKAFAKELAYLATSAGVPTYNLDLTGHGRRIQQSARESWASTPAAPPADASRGGLMARLRSAIAA
ncbi:MAG: hypothetical protein JWP31_711 [Aeromicrobium sp.]|nr:hypothetical protein [Aeromicrobium sp.]